jgi:hypothetical protein
VKLLPSALVLVTLAAERDAKARVNLVILANVDGTDTFHVIDYADIPPDRLKEVCYSNVVCKVCTEKADPDRTRITIAGNRICYPGDVGTKTAPLELVKLRINSVLSRKGAKFCTFDISNFYL